MESQEVILLWNYNERTVTLVILKNFFFLKKKEHYNCCTRGCVFSEVALALTLYVEVE